MNDKDIKWGLAGADNDWYMPRVSFWKRWPIIRHVRTLHAAWQVHRHYEVYTGVLGMTPTGHDDWVLYGMWRGYERLTTEETTE